MSVEENKSNSPQPFYVKCYQKVKTREEMERNIANICRVVMVVDNIQTLNFSFEVLDPIQKIRYNFSREIYSIHPYLLQGAGVTLSKN